MTSTTEMHLEVGLCKVVSGSAGTGLYALVHGSCTVYQLEQTNIPSLGYRHSTESLHRGTSSSRESRSIAFTWMSADNAAGLHVPTYGAFEHARPTMVRSMMPSQKGPHALQV